MPLDVRSTVYSAYWATILAGQAAYNASVPALNAAVDAASPADVLFGLPSYPMLRAENLYDERRQNVRAILRDMPTLPAGAGFPKVLLLAQSETGPTVVTRTFGWAQGDGCNVIHSVTVTLARVIVHDSPAVSLLSQSPLAVQLDVAELAARPKFGLSYMRDLISITTRRGDEQAFGATRMVERRTVTFDLRPRQSDLTA